MDRLNWTKQENWVWEQVIQGRTADLNYFSNDERNDHRKIPQYPRTQVLRSDFLETILKNSSYKDCITSNGVAIENAEIDLNFSLINAELKPLLIFERCHFSGNVYFSRLKAKSLIIFDKCEFRNMLNCDSLDSRSDIYINNCKIPNLKLTNASLKGGISLSGTFISESLEASSLILGKSLFMNEGGGYGHINLRGSYIHGNLEMMNSQFHEKIDLTSVQIGQDIHLSFGSIFHKEVNLTGARINSQIDLTRSVFRGKIIMSSTFIKSNILIKGIEDNVPIGDPSLSNPYLKTIINHFSVIGSYIGGALEVNNVLFFDSLEVDSSTINLDINIIYSNLDLSTARIIFTKIGKSLKVSSSSFKSLDISGTKIEKDLDMGRSGNAAMDIPPVWGEDSHLNLRNAQVGAIQDLSNSWPRSIDLEGFKYNELGGFGAGDIDRFVDRDLEWFKNWLGERYEIINPPENLRSILPIKRKYKVNQSYYPQPYIQLSKCLRKNGHIDTANNILFAAKVRDLNHTKSGKRKLWLQLQYWIVGFGFRYEWSFLWFLAFVTFGTILFDLIVFPESSIASHYSFFDGLFYNLDTILPIVDLSKEHNEIAIPGISKYFFYLENIVGYILAIYITAALTGITKKP